MLHRHIVIAECVLTITALTLMVAPAAARPLTAATTIATAVLKPPPGMIRALQRDLRLTEEQARIRLFNELRLARVEAELRAKLGDRFGGSWLVGTIAQTLVVTTTNPADLPQIIAAGARGQLVEKSLTELDQTLKTFDEASTTSGGKVRYIDVKNNRIVILTPDPLKAEDFIESAGNSNLIQAVPSTEDPKILNDIKGGDIYRVGPTSRCSVGFSVTKQAQRGFVTAGHCGAAAASATDADWTPLGTFQKSNFPDSDFAWVAVNDNKTPKPLVDSSTGGMINVAGSREALVGASVCRSGAASGWYCGTILQRNTSVAYVQGTVHGLVRTDVCAEEGDSGGPFISVDQAQGVTSGGSGNCELGGVTYFQPIDEILTNYELTLLTIDNPQPSCTDYLKTVTGTLTNGESVYRPNNSSYRSTINGVHSACLDVDGVDLDLDLDLELQKREGKNWVTVATSDRLNPDEKISYTGAPGDYRYRVTSSNGIGSYTLKYKTP
ncbi:Alpha-lytic protease prodomain-containing protein [Streptosporangium subroseum]|uniref:Alpha-lytic protease prodomain-containing protein n=1 Tax=Streptosporangium subroseum TaxID=106412 RepID=A0A239PB35_9ACTN|nr:S1 family peptidase [Streptosporangium subroseum]SNT64155.1 Alpha-lytic protease prodomain-containing protein [Streptosporangium subroseum]